MKFKRIMMCLLIWIWLGAVPVLAVEQDKCGVWDYAGLITDREMERLDAACIELANELDMNVVIFTADGMSGTIGKFAADTYEQISNESGIMLMIEMSERWIHVYEYQKGDKNYRYSDSEIYEIYDGVRYFATDGNYCDGMMEFIDLARRYSDVEKEKPRGDYLNYEAGSGWYNSKDNFIPYSSTIIALFVCIAIGGIAVLIMYFSQRSKKVTDGSVYMDGALEVLEREDVYTHTTKQVIHHESSSSGGGGGHSGGGGHGGGGHF